MAVTRSDIDALDKAITSGILSVRHSDGKQIQYRSINDLIRARDIAISLLKGRRGFKSRTLQVAVDTNLGSPLNEDFDRNS